MNCGTMGLQICHSDQGGVASWPALPYASFIARSVVVARAVIEQFLANGSGGGTLVGLVQWLLLVAFFATYFSEKVREA
jgi:hypothetical protein